MKITNYIWSLIAVSCICFTSCDKKLAPQIEEFPISGFHSIDIKHFMNVVLEQDTSFYIETSGSKKFTSELNFDVVDSILYISNDKSFTWLNPKKKLLTVTIHAPDFREISIHKSCHLTNIDTLRLNELILNFTGKQASAELSMHADVFAFWNNNPNGGQIDLSGTCDHLKAWAYALINIEAQQLETREATILHSTRGFININASEKLRYSIQNEGELNVYGSPANIEILEPNTGTGNLIIH